MKAKPVRHSGNWYRRGISLAWGLILAIGASPASRSQTVPAQAPGIQQAALPALVDAATATSSARALATLAQWEGMPVRHISFAGVTITRLAPLPDHLAQSPGAPLRQENLKKSLRQLYATGLYETVQVEGSPEGDGVALVFRGEPRAFLGTIGLDGAKGATLPAQLISASQLSSGTRITSAKLNQAVELMRRTLAENGFNESVITQTLTPHPEEQLVDVAFHIVSGPQARVGTVAVSGDSGMSAEDFRHRTRLRSGSRVDHETGNRALSRVLKHYRSQDRLEAEIKIESQQYAQESHKTDFNFSASQGPIVMVKVEGVKMTPERIKRVIPIFEEGTVDDDLLNEGNRRLRDYYQRLGYFNVKVDHEQHSAGTDRVTILYNVQLGARGRVEHVSVTGNHYFDSASLKDLLSVRVADSIDRHGVFSQSLVAADISSLQGVYRNNGFSSPVVSYEATTAAVARNDAQAGSGDQGGKSPLPVRKTGKNATVPLSVLYHIEEGSQQRVGTVQLVGAEQVKPEKLLPLLNTSAGQLLSPQNLAGDRDALLTDYMSRGFDQVQVDVTQQIDPADANKVNVAFHIVEGKQIFVRKVLITGNHYTRPETIARAITLHPGDPLNETALSQTQSNLYGYALFNEVDTAIENPSGGESYKTILLQLEEARRWALTYGLGFEAGMGTPQYNCAGIIASGASCNPNGKTGFSYRFLADITRNNLFGREQSASLRGTYGLLEKKVDLIYQVPRFVGNRNFGLSLSGGYASSLDVSTYVATKLEGSFRLTESFLSPGSHLSKANTLVYELDFRRVKALAYSLQVAPGEIEQLATAVRVAGPALTWIRDTRDSPLDAHKGSYTSFQDFFSDNVFGSQANFNRLDLTNSSYYGFDKGRFVLARNTRYGQERAFGSPSEELIPLPERLYAGGATSLRSFGSNSAGPRDPETGYPIGGAGALIESTELRLPAPTLPGVGNNISFVLFHDMGNVFTNASDAWISALRIHQPDRDSCKTLSVPASTSTPPGRVTSTGWQGSCSFNYFSHAPGLGLRYHTPIGPIRFDMSYNLNPPIYPVIYNYSLSSPASEPHVGQAIHFNYFFSLGQTF